MPNERRPPRASAPLDYYGLPAASPEWPTRWQILGAWLLPVALQFVCWFALFRPTDPDITGWIRTRNFVRGIVGIPSHITFSLGLTDPNGLAAHVIMACIVWPVLLTVVTLTPLRRLPLIVHLVCAFLWTFGGCGLFMAI